MIGLQFYIEHRQGSNVGHVTASANQESRKNLRRQSSSLTKSEHDAATTTANKNILCNVIMALRMAMWRRDLSFRNLT